METNKIYCGNNVDIIKKLIESESIDLIVTSPPYDDLRNYNGYCWDYKELGKEMFRILKNGGVVVWIVGDATINGSETGASFKQVLYFKEIGFNLHDTMIYAKNSCKFPESNRYYNIFEFMFILSKGSPSNFNPIKDRKNKTHVTKISKSKFREGKEGTFKRSNSGAGKIISENGVRFNIWYYNTGENTKDTLAYNHPAIFPEHLANDHIISWSNEGDIVLDPFCGSGTTLKMAYLNNRKYIGIDISREYCELSEKRLEEAKKQYKLF